MGSIPLILKNLSVVDPQSEFNHQNVDIKIEGNIISQIGPANTISDEKSIVHEFEQAFVSPGWVDMHVHLSDPGFEHKETLSQLANAAKSGGFTAIMCSPNVSPPVDSAFHINSLKTRTHGLGIEFLFTGCITSHAEGKELAEVYDMHQAGAIGYGDGNHPIQKAGIVMRALQYLKAFDGLLIMSPEDKSISGTGQMEEGLISTRLGLKGIPEIAESIAVSRDLDLYQYNPGRLHIQPVTSKEGISRIKAVKENHPELSVGTNLYYLILNDESLLTFDPDYKVFPPLKTEDGQKFLIEALQSGWIDTLGSGHHPQGPEEKKVEFEIAEPGMLGLQTFFALANTYLIREEKISLSKLIELIAINPRKILKQPSVSVSINAEANLTIFDTGMDWKFSSDKIPSRAKNSPFIGQSFTGKPLATFYQGELSFSNL